MGIDHKALSREEGMVLMSSLAILSVLMVIGIGLGTMLQNDYRVLANLRGGTEAFYFSVAGIEWSKAEIATLTSFPPLPSNETKDFSTGQFAVSFLSSAVAGPLDAKVVVRSVGTHRTAESVVQARLTKSYDLSDAALGLRGNGSRVNLSGDAIFISGADHDPSDGSLVSGAKPRSSVSVSDNGLRTLVLQALGDPPRSGVLDSSDGFQAVTTSGYLPSAFVAQLANQLCASATATVHVIPAGSSLMLENQTWGSQAAPQLHCVDGSSAAGDEVSLASVTGAGIIVVREADLNLTGGFRWEGLLLVTGSEISMKATGSSTKEIFGAAVVNEAGIPNASRALLDVDGNLRLLFSRKALSRTASLLPVASLSSAYASLPFLISQDYWRTVTP
ncbi:MAG: hypothetical protein ACM3SP_26855 [Chloroflexota bacterium]